MRKVFIMQGEHLSNINKLFDAVRTELQEQRRRFLDVYNEYDPKYSNIEHRIISQCNKYLDPQENRGKGLQAMASDIIMRVRSFRHKRLLLIEKAGMIGLAAEQRATNLMVDWLEMVIRGFPVVSSTDPIHKLGAVSEYSNVVRESAGTSMLRTVEVMEGNARAFELGSHLITMRGSLLKQYYDESVKEIDLQTIIEAMKSVLLVESRESAKERLIEVIKKIPEIGAAVVGVYVPIAKAIDISIKLKKKIAEIRPTYRKRGPEDDLDNFAEILEADDEAVDLIVEQLDTYLHFLTPPENEVEPDAPPPA